MIPPVSNFHGAVAKAELVKKLLLRQTVGNNWENVAVDVVPWMARESSRWSAVSGQEALNLSVMITLC